MLSYIDFFSTKILVKHPLNVWKHTAYLILKLPRKIIVFNISTQVHGSSVRGFITYLKKYEERKATNREPRT
jgi:hypothetical protein